MLRGAWCEPAPRTLRYSPVPKRYAIAPDPALLVPAISHEDSGAAAARELIARYRVKTPSPDTEIANLSGGNVQRAVLAREIAGDVDVLIVANPCFGLDFASVAEIRAIVRAKAQKKPIPEGLSLREGWRRKLVWPLIEAVLDGKRLLRLKGFGGESPIEYQLPATETEAPSPGESAPAE